MMEIEFTSRRDNEVLGREELQFEVTYPGDATPERETVRDNIAAQVGANSGLVVVDHIKPRYGMPRARGYAKVYESVDAIREIESAHILLRNGLIDEEEVEEPTEPDEADEEPGEEPDEAEEPDEPDEAEPDEADEPEDEPDKAEDAGEPDEEAERADETEEPDAPEEAEDASEADEAPEGGDDEAEAADDADDDEDADA